MPPPPNFCDFSRKAFSSELYPSTRILTSHGGLRDFDSEITKNTPSQELELLIENCAGDWCVETNDCIRGGYRLV